LLAPIVFALELVA
jgi:hypothetical protein